MKYFLMISIGLLAACEPEDPVMVGGDRDAHGCIPSAGYMWSEDKQKCVRAWEED